MENEKSKKGWGLFVLGLVIGLLVSLIIISFIFRQNVQLSDDTLLNEQVLDKVGSL